MNLLKTKIGLTNGKSFIIFHNLPEEIFKTTVNNWLASPELSKNPKSLVKLLELIGYTAFTEKQYKRQGIITRKIK
jgi:hypothetical protein